MLFNIIKTLKTKGIMGINCRNLDYILRMNPRKLITAVDDKLQTKMLAQSINIAVPKLYGHIDVEAEIDSLEKIIQPYQDFVIKPAHGTGGKGIIIIKERIRDKFRKSNDAILTLKQMQQHLIKVLSGVYSLAGYPDQAIIEYRVIADDIFKDITYQGVPDVRTVVFYGYPVMAMLRLPTIKSEGKANLHQGAIGVGVNLASGMTEIGVQQNRNIKEHPDTLSPLANLTIPHWDKILMIASSCYDLTHLGYIGVDIIIDKALGPLILEINARPGLNIQIANQDGLIRRMNLIRKNMQAEHRISDKIQISKQLFNRSFDFAS